MADIRTVDLLIDYLDHQMAWRIKEIATMTSLVNKNKKDNTIVRAAIPLLYAHWEGFIKDSAIKFLDYLSVKKLKYCELKHCFAVTGLKEELHKLVDSKKIDLLTDTYVFLLDKQNEHAFFTGKKHVHTESNLKSHVFDNIAKTLGVDVTKYESKYNFIDESLLKRRNTIAHGEYLDIKHEDWKEVSETTLELMRMFKDDLMNCSVLESYKR